MRMLAAALLADLVSCSGIFGPLSDGKPYALTRINGQSVPWTSPLDSVQVTAGWIKLVDDTLAQRHEEFESGGGASQASWTLSGRYALVPWMLIIDYRPAWHAGNIGPSQPVDTFRVSGDGFALRERGYLAPLDSIVRFYARP